MMNMERLEKILNNRKIYLPLMALILLVSVFLKTWRLTSVPSGIHVDEAGMAYDAWCLANFGMDRWLNSWPVYLINFGGGQSALLAYLVMIAIRLTGDFSLLTIRIVSVLLSVLASICWVVFLHKTMDRVFALLGAGLLSIMPYFIMQCRFGLDCNLLVNMLSISLLCTLIAVRKDRYPFYFLAGACWGLTYYTYALSYIPNTLIILTISLVLFLQDRKRLKKLLVMLIPIVLMGMPLFLMLLINTLDKGVKHFGPITIPRLPNYRGGEFTFEPARILENFLTVVRNILSYDWLPHNSLEEHWIFYKISVPFLILGFLKYGWDTVQAIRQKALSFRHGWMAGFFFYFLEGCFLAGDGPNINKLNGILYAQMFILVYGILFALQMFREKYMLPAAVLLGAVYVWSFLSFGLDYYSQKQPRIFFMDSYADLAEAVKEDLAENNRSFYPESNDRYENEILFAVTFLPDPRDLDVTKRYLEYGHYRIRQKNREFFPDSWMVVHKDQEGNSLVPDMVVKDALENRAYDCVLTGTIEENLEKLTKDGYVCLLEMRDDASLLTPDGEITSFHDFHDPENRFATEYGELGIASGDDEAYSISLAGNTLWRSDEAEYAALQRRLICIDPETGESVFAMSEYSAGY